jgi:hypothetical protein
MPMSYTQPLTFSFIEYFLCIMLFTLYDTYPKYSTALCLIALTKLFENIIYSLPMHFSPTSYYLLFLLSTVTLDITFFNQRDNEFNIHTKC